MPVSQRASRAGSFSWTVNFDTLVESHAEVPLEVFADDEEFESAGPPTSLGISLIRSRRCLT